MAFNWREVMKWGVGFSEFPKGWKEERETDGGKECTEGVLKVDAMVA